jgi:Tol biopolymer transport system component
MDIRLRNAAIVACVAIAMPLAAAAPAHATLPGKNGLIAFQVEGADGNRIYTVRPNGHDLRLVTTGTANAEAPDWSPDGRWIAFTKNFCKVALIQPDGTGLHRIDPAPDGCEYDPTFTPDGQHLIFERYDEVADDDAIWIMDLDGSDRRRIGNGGNGEAHTPEISPDGRTVSFLSFAEDGLSAIFGIDIGGGDAWQMTPTLYGMTFKHDWAPDGSRLVMSDNAGNTERPANVLTIRPDGTGLRYLTDYRTPDQRAFAGTYSPDGKWVVYRHESGAELSELVIVRTDGQGAHVVLPLSTFRPRFIDWGPAAS